MPLSDSPPLLTRRLCCLGLPLLAAWPRAQAADPVVLTLAGTLERVSGQRELDYTMAALAALPQHQLLTSTPWDKQVRRYTGPLLRDLLEAAGARGTTVRATALNDYRVDIPISDARNFDLIVARLVDDQPMRVRDRGPLALIYPYDTDAQLRTERYLSRSAWQLRRLEVK